jgi:kynurenine formamidase
MTAPAREMTEAELDALFERTKNWGRWGADDERGALNYITEKKTAQAASLVGLGRSVSCALDLATVPGANNPVPVAHYMIRAGDIQEGTGSADYFAVASHGISITHLDALCHIFNRELMYNGRPKSLVTSTGALANSIQSGRDGIVSRGVLLDIPRLGGRQWLEPGDAIYIEDLEAAEAAQGVRVEEGDILLIDTGRHQRQQQHQTHEGLPDGKLAGLHASALDWLHQRRVALLGCDGVSDVMPSGGAGIYRLPIHSIAIPGIGLHLLDNADLGELAATCAELGRYEFMFTLAPLRLAKGTASPVNPIALF